QPAALLPSGAQYIAGPHGQVAPVGTDIPMTPAADGSYVRGVPGAYARREVAGLLPPGPRFTGDAGGNVAEDAERLRGAPASSADASSVRSVPAAPLAHDI